MQGYQWAHPKELEGFTGTEIWTLRGLLGTSPEFESLMLWILLKMADKPPLDSMLFCMPMLDSESDGGNSMDCFFLNLLNNKSINDMYNAHPAEAPMAIAAILPFPAEDVFCSDAVSSDPLFDPDVEPDPDGPDDVSDISRPVNGILLSIKTAKAFSVSSGFL